MRRLALATAVLVAACTGPAPAPSPSTAASARSGTNTSVLLITIDTLRADHMSLYGYRRATTPKLDAFGRDAAVFDRAYTFWPKTRGSFVMMMTGRRPSQNGYGKNHQVLLDFNATIASSLQAAGYRTAAIVDNPNVAKSLGYAKGFDSYRETWEEPTLGSEVDRARAITQGGASFLRSAATDKPFFLWLHYVSPHAPYAPPPPYDTIFAGDGDSGPRLGTVDSFHGGIPKQWHVAGKDRLAWYVSQYDGEIAAVDAEVGQVLEALAASPSAGNTLVVVTSDHGESLGEHDYYFDHGENLFDPSLHVPLIVAAPGRRGGLRSDALASTLDVFPTILDAAKISWPPDLAGESLLSAATGGAGTTRDRLFAQNERHLSASFDERYKIVSVPQDAGGARYAFFDRAKDPGETHDLAPSPPEALRPARRELELFLERSDREWSATRYRVGDAPGEGKMSRDACEKLRALGYVSTCAP